MPTKRNRSQIAQFVIDSFRTHGITLHSQSRLGRMCNVLTGPRAEAGTIIKTSDPDYPAALEAVRELQILEFIFERFPPDSRNDRFTRILRMAIKDSLHPEADRQISRGRDLQFELLVGAVCHAAGFTAVEFSEPDITCKLGTLHFGIAVKRIKSESGIEAAIRRAANQIQVMRSRCHTDRPGIIAVDTGLALNPSNHAFVGSVSERECERFHFLAVKRFVTKYYDRMIEWIRGRGVRGIVLHDHRIFYGHELEWTPQSMNWFVETARGNARRKREASEFWAHYSSGLPNNKECL